MSKRPTLSQILPKVELRRLQTKSNWRALQMLLFNWVFVFAIFACVIVWPNIVSFTVGAILLGGRQLGLAILVHDCAHKSMFVSERVNDFVGHYLCGAPINLSLYDYRDSHLKHHKFAGTDDDPDKIFVDKYPITKASLKRKIMRDVSGQTGFRDTVRKLSHFTLKQHWPWLIFHLSGFILIASLGAPAAYLMWWAAEIFVFPVIVRIRQIGEHGIAENRGQRAPRMNTGTTLASWWERLLLAPNYVNYHVEHHQFASVPSYHLPELHIRLAQGGYFDDYNCIANGYAEVLRRALRPDGLEHTAV